MVNLGAVWRGAEVLLRRRHLLLPHMQIKSIAELDLLALRTCGVRYIVFDKDNCLTAPHETRLHPAVEAEFEACKKAFGAEQIAVMSNTAGSSDDAGGEQGRALEAMLGVPVLAHGGKKPEGAHLVLERFRCRPHQVAFVGDRVLTDVLTGNLGGFFTFLTEPLTGIEDAAFVSPARRFEQAVLRLLQRRGVCPPYVPSVEVYQRKQAQKESAGDGTGESPA